MRAERALAALGVAALAVGCGGGEPPPETPATAPSAPAGPAGQASEAACNELFLGAMALEQASDSLAKHGPRPTAAARIRTGRKLIAGYTELRAQLKRAVELDRSLTTEVDAADKALATPVAWFDAATKSQEAHAKQMREIYAEVERLRPAFSAPCKPKEPDCAATASVALNLLLADWSAAALPKTRGDLQKIEPRSPDLQAKLKTLVQKIEEAERSLTEQEKQAEALQATMGEEKNEGIAKAIDKLYARCGVKEKDDKPLTAVRRTQWVTSKEPDLRKMVVVIRVLPEGRIRARLDEWSQLSVGLRRTVFESATRGGFGSGFFVVPREGEVYVVTNRHVVDFGESASLQMPDGAVIPAQIAYTDPNADIAILKPSKPTVSYGLALETEPAKDHQVVIATGYPGLDARPSYQTTRGYVSNQHFVDPWDGASYIQHTAPIDKGNSGGPLTSERFNVLGVNTLKIRSREAVAMSVPATLVADAVARAGAKVDTESQQEDARAACLEVVAELGAPKPNVHTLYRRISLAMVSESGSTSFNTQAGRDRELEDMLLESPIDALRAAIVDRLMLESKTTRINPWETCANPEPDDWQHILTMDRVRFHLRVGGDTKDLVLRREHGRYQLLRLDLTPPTPDPTPTKKPAKKPTKKPTK
ncbi:MAG: trypsin-like peptidase domain-containing protein [Labilithrix sp.]|nr:trypsin-like peptidase domain-containing protein [Labilithrix sp.]MCW5814477.1 trypsin-like peptidase domain-containing protein [Labilithrix sp.]